MYIFIMCVGVRKSTLSVITSPSCIKSSAPNRTERVRAQEQKKIIQLPHAKLHFPARTISDLIFSAPVLPTPRCNEEIRLNQIYRLADY